ncbi:MAG: helix-turn-helix domain-containing protein [Lachnospiraceae bacterium]|nr:helix-turn-helix domain-containing protein [Lachnospiraceae bacterium]
MKESPKVEIKDKINLTIEEAAAYSNIGINKIRKMTDEPSCPFVLYIGKGRRVIKRKEFERYLEKVAEV